MAKKTSSKTLRKKADKLFSEFIRRRDSDAEGFGSCITCQKRLHWKDAHNGHFMSRRYSSTRYDPENCNLQCTGCNTFRGGEQYLYGIEVDRKFGAGTAKRLAKKAKLTVKLTAQDYETIIEEAKRELEIYDTVPKAN